MCASSAVSNIIYRQSRKKKPRALWHNMRVSSTTGIHQVLMNPVWHIFLMLHIDFNYWVNRFPYTVGSGYCGALNYVVYFLRVCARACVCVCVSIFNIPFKHTSVCMYLS